MKVAIAGSTQEMEAVREVWPKFSRFLPGPPGAAEEPQFLQYDVRGGTPGLALSLEDLMRGARERAESLILQFRRERAEADYFVGFQSGFHTTTSQGPRRLVFLETWAYVTDGHRGGFGHSGGIQIPPKIADPVIDRGIDLGIVVDRVAEETGLPPRAGLWSLLGREVLADRGACMTAVLAAFAPFFNLPVYK